MVVTEDIREAIVRRASINEIRTIARKNGMVSMYQDGMRKAARGITSIEEVLRMHHE
jgi:general secretion pathway protein E